jgi:transcriptional regulator with XRE-family HTH domain
MPRTYPLTPRQRRKSPILHVPTGKIARERLELIRAREALGLSRPKLAEKTGLSRTHIFRVETGAVDPGLDSIVTWLTALGPDAPITLFEPHPRVAQWVALILRNVIAREKLVA